MVFTLWDVDSQDAVTFEVSIVATRYVTGNEFVQNVGKTVVTEQMAVTVSDGY